MPVVTAAATATALPKQLSDGNPNGTALGTGPTDAIGFYTSANQGSAGGPVTQPTDASQIAPVIGAQSGLITSYSTQQSPTAVTLNTTVESSLTVDGGTNPTIQLATTDMIYAFNKPTSQAGLSVGNAYVSAGNTIKASFGNVTGSTVTPTSGQNYGVVALRGFPTFTAALTPAAVAANTTVEQVFTLTGLAAGQGIPAGYLLQVTKPTNQAGLDILGCRVISSNVVGITFANFTASPITPTAAEAYRFFALSGLDTLHNHLYYQMNADTVGAVGGGIVVSGGNTALLGILATDTVGPLFKPSAQAAATNASALYLGIPTADVMTLYFLSTGSGATPTAAEVYGVNVMRTNPVAPLLMYSPSLAPVSVAANTSAEQTFTVTGLRSGTPVWLNKPTPQPGLGIGGVRVSATDTLAINYVNLTAAAIVPATETYLVGNFQTKLPGVSAGNKCQSVSQAAGAADYQTKTLLRNMRANLVAQGLMKGA